MEASTYLCNQANKVEEQAEVRSVDTESSLEWNLIQGVTVVLPCVAEANVGKTDGTPSEESRQAGEGLKPSEDFRPTRAQADKGHKAEKNDDDDGKERSAGLVNVGEDFGGISLLSQSRQGARSAIDGRDTDGQDRNKNDKVHKGIEPFQAGVLANKHKWRCLGIIVCSSSQQGLVAIVNEQADKEQTQNIEQGNTPKDLLDGAGQRPEGIRGLGGSKTNQLRTGKRERCRDKHRAEALEAILEGTGVVPVSCAPVFVVTATLGTTSANHDKGDDHEDDGRSQLEDCRGEFFFGVPKGSKYVDNDDKDEEDGNPDADRNVSVPVLNRDATDCEFQWQDGCPLKDVVPTHSKAPRRIDEACRVGVEAARNRIHDSKFTESVHCPNVLVACVLL